MKAEPASPVTPHWFGDRIDDHVTGSQNVTTHQHSARFRCPWIALRITVQDINDHCIELQSRISPAKE
jgi:hypothetical protein